MCKLAEQFARFCSILKAPKVNATSIALCIFKVRSRPYTYSESKLFEPVEVSPVRHSSHPQGQPQQVPRPWQLLCLLFALTVLKAPSALTAHSKQMSPSSSICVQLAVAVFLCRDPICEQRSHTQRSILQAYQICPTSGCDSFRESCITVHLMRIAAWIILCTVQQQIDLYEEVYLGLGQLPLQLSKECRLADLGSTLCLGASLLRFLLLLLCFGHRIEKPHHAPAPGHI